LTIVLALTLLSWEDVFTVEKHKKEKPMFNDAYQEHLDHEFNSQFDDNRERYGQPCHCGTLTWGGDCPKCMRDEEDAPMSPEAYAAYVAAQPADVQAALVDDDIPF
jgi:hypothetical protein